MYRIIHRYDELGYWGYFLWYGRKHLYQAKGMKLVFGYNVSKPMRVKWDKQRQTWVQA